MFKLLFLLAFLGFTVPMSINFSGWFIILWVILGLLISYISIIVLFLISIFIFEKVSIHNRFKNYVVRSFVSAANILAFNLRIKVVNPENIPKTGGVVAYANHKSYLDALVLLQSIKRPNAYTPKDSLFKIPFLRRLMLSIGSMPVYRGDDRKTAKALINAIKNVSNGFFMTVFPEGGRKNRDTDEVLQTKAGAFKLALKSKATILPMTINNSALIKHHAPFRKTIVTLVVGKPIPYEEYSHLTTSEIADLVQEKMNEGLI